METALYSDTSRGLPCPGSPVWEARSGRRYGSGYSILYLPYISAALHSSWPGADIRRTDGRGRSGAPPGPATVPVFSSGAMGQGVAVDPSEGILVAPADGEINLLADTKHAVGLKTAQGAELLMHVGLDTVELEGQPFTIKVAVGDQVKQGDVLLEIDLDAIKNAGKATTTPVIVTNAGDYTEVKVNNDAADGQPLIELTK